MENLKDDSICIHGGYKAKSGESQVLPTHQSTTYRYYDPDKLADLFDLKEEGFIYSRLGNPTVAAFEKKMANLEKGIGAVAFSSGQSAVLSSILNICKKGDHILASSKLYGGTITLLKSTLSNFGIKVTLVDPNLSQKEISKKIQNNTKVIYGETIGNPGLNILDFEKFSEISKKNNIVFIVDNTFATPYLFKPLKHGADIVVHSATKYIDGHAVALGGVVIDSGNFNWEASNKYPSLTKPDESYHGIIFNEKFGKQAYLTKLRVKILRDLGNTLSPQNANLLHRGLETLHLRMDRHSENALKVAKFLEKHPKITWVNYPFLESHDTYDLAKKYLKKGGSGVLSFGIKGKIKSAKRFMKSIDMISLVTHVGDLRTSVLHPASTSHRQLSDEELEECGVKKELIRLSVGIESCDDIINDLKKALKEV
ncbi:MAG: O-acetylhomoserine aminocarboxypropyltransferase/cysteine synthase family protein [Bacillota bacterium]